MIKHQEGGNYFYNHDLKTAFPKRAYDNFDIQRLTLTKISKETQTDHIELETYVIKQEPPEDSSESQEHYFPKGRHEEWSTEGEVKIYNSGEIIPTNAVEIKYDCIQRVDAEMLTTTQMEFEEGAINTMPSSMKSHNVQTKLSELLTMADAVRHIKDEKLINVCKQEINLTRIKTVDNGLTNHKTKRGRKGKLENVKKKGTHKSETNVMSKSRSANEVRNANRKLRVGERKFKFPKDQSIQQFTCKICEAVYDTKFRWEIHIEDKHYHSYKLQCEKCFVPYVDDDDIMSHNCNVSFILTHVCPGCVDENEFRYRSNLVRHLEKDHANVFPLTCEICQKRLVSELDQRYHMTVHDPTLKYCKVCDKQCVNLLELDDHNLIHCGIRRYTCHLCQHAFKTKASLKMHLVKHGINQRLCMCERCGRSFHHPQLLAKHIAGYCNDRTYVCGLCNAQLGSMETLKRHKRTHTGERPYICEKCGVAFARSAGLKYHIKYKHSFEKNFKCSQCDKAFVKRATLQRHERVHLKIYPYDCEQCGKQFATKWNLKSHVRRHTGETPYICSKCGLGFAHNVVRKTHETKCNNIS